MGQRIITTCDKCDAEEGVETVVISNSKAVEVDLCAADRESIPLGEAVSLARPHVKRRQPRKTAAAKATAAPSATPTRRGGRRAQVSTLSDVSAKKTAAKK
jgi:hypothetical protein